MVGDKPEARSPRKNATISKTFKPVRLVSVSVQFIKGLDEELGGISLRKGRNSGTKTVVLLFERVQAMEKGRSFINKIETLNLFDEEGEITVIPNGMKFQFVDDDNLSQAECSFEVTSDEAWERVMRFLHRYAEAHGFEFQAPQI